MGSDISRRTFDPNRHYSQVVMQQGRVQLDADWNEQQEIIRHRVEAETRDIVGPDGVPGERGGFGITFAPGYRDLLISPGHMYVDGMLCEESETTIHVRFVESDRVQLQEREWMPNGRLFEKGQWVEVLREEQHPYRHFQIIDVDQANLQLKFSHGWSEFAQLPERRMCRVTSYTTQPGYPDAPFTHINPATGLKELDLGDQHIFLAYLEVWQRPVTALDDPRIREVALGGPDTATRLQTFWQVKIEPVEHPRDLKTLQEEQQKEREELEKQEEERKRLQAHGHPRERERLDDETAEREEKIKRLDDDIRNTLRAHDCDRSFDKWEKCIKHPTGTLNATTYNAANPEYSGYQGTENQLYRVEIHQVDAGEKPLVFKWARDNASRVAEALVTGADGTLVKILSAGQGGILNFTPGQFVEVVSHQNGQVGALVSITLVNYEINQLTLDSAIGKNGDQLAIRLWNGKGEHISADTFMPLEYGIQVAFSDGTYHTGDYWLIPARASTGEIEWPFYQVSSASDNSGRRPVPQPRQGIRHHYTRLACVYYHRGQEDAYGHVHDSRRHFSPLTYVMPAMHIVGINWQNDRIYRHKDLRRNGLLHGGLKIIFDARLDDRYIERMAASMIVALETEMSGGESKITVINRKFKFDEDDPYAIIWRWHKDDLHRDKDEDEDEDTILSWFRELLKRGFDDEEHPVRVRITLKGHSIWSERDDRYIYLDGQAFGVPVEEENRIALNVEWSRPSGAGQRASDFESWFYIHRDERVEDKQEDKQEKDRKDEQREDNSNEVAPIPSRARFISFILRIFHRS